MTDFYPEVRILKDARWIMRQTAASELAAAIGADSRNRGPLMPFATKTGRCAPPKSSFILAAPAFMRFMIQAPPGHAVVYADYQRQEYWLSAVLSGDRKMRAAYLAGDPYLEFAKSRGAILPDTTKDDLERIREEHKTTVLAVSYGQVRAPSRAGSGSRCPMRSNSLTGTVASIRATGAGQTGSRQT